MVFYSSPWANTCTRRKKGLVDQFLWVWAGKKCDRWFIDITTTISSVIWLLCLPLQVSGEHGHVTIPGSKNIGHIMLPYVSNCSYLREMSWDFHPVYNNLDNHWNLKGTSLWQFFLLHCFWWKKTRCNCAAHTKNLPWAFIGKWCGRVRL